MAETRRSTKLWSMDTVEAVREGASDAALLEAAVWNISVTLASVFVAGEGVLKFVQRQSRPKEEVGWVVRGESGQSVFQQECLSLHSRRQRVGPRVSVDLNQNVEYIPEQPQWVEYRDPTPPSPPPSVDEYSPGQTQSVPSVPSGGTSSSRGSKRKAPMVDVIDSQFDKLTTSLDGFANVLSSSNVHFGVISDAAVRQVSAMEDRNKILRHNPNYTYTEADIYEMLTSMNITDENLLDQCYDFLCGNPTCTKRLMGLPPHKRWNKLWKMISGGDC
ncbi:uncharacterized protein HKW66_Vig0117540 [Vigna angularis]|uniref:Uncharacterized protein n=1 Tax=Phaseolus angularis TaxID=3914 RepID=A0A8T0JZF1_PHAAN|nr:uncharacterized protein HKW66_Vig0117540 [Vigna angularis]